MRIASEMGFQSINYDDLEVWRKGKDLLPERPIMIDFDHPVRSMRYEVFDILQRYGFKGNLFIYTAPYDRQYSRPLSLSETPEHMTWEEIGQLRDAGWHIGAHTVSHPNLSALSVEDPTGTVVRQELDRCNEVIQKNLGFIPKDFAFTGTSWSSVAEAEVKKRYRFGRLWFVGAEYEVDGQRMRVADLLGVPGTDEADGGPPHAARYITRESDPYRLPSMELQALINSPEAFRAYLEGALRD
jgi:peptidoglycan/xylan/chitin deacetylase (PgdA/CDA1 family)